MKYPRLQTDPSLVCRVTTMGAKPRLRGAFFDVEPQEHACTASPSVDARSTAALDDDEPGVVKQEHFRSTFGKWELNNARVSRYFLAWRDEKLSALTRRVVKQFRVRALLCARRPRELLAGAHSYPMLCTVTTVRAFSPQFHR